MTAVTHPIQVQPFSRRRHHPAITAALVSLFWIMATILVLTAHVEIAPRSALGGATATLGAIVVSAYCYTRCAARQAGVTHALGVGIAWLVLSIVVEMALATRLGHGWFSLLGSPGQALLRNVTMFAWIFAPAIFAHGQE